MNVDVSIEYYVKTITLQALMPIYYSLAIAVLPAPSTFCSRIFMTWPPPPEKAATVSAV